MAYDSDYEIRLATLEAMGGDVTKHYDSVYAIDLEILRLTEQGGGGASIEEVDVLPDAEENKNQLVRLSTDNKVYVSECTSEGSEGNPGLGFAAIQLYYGEDNGTQIFKRYPEMDNMNEGNYYSTDNQIAWVLINNSYDINFNEITDWNSYLEFVLYTPSTVVSVGDTYENFDSGVNDEVMDYSPNVGYVPPTPAVWIWKPLDSTIKEVSALPDAEENKNQLVRLSTDKKVYVSECTSEGSEGNPGLGFAAIQAEDDESTGETYLYKRYPEEDTQSSYAWAKVNNSFKKNISDTTVDWYDVDASYIEYTDSETPEIGSTLPNDDIVTDYSQNVGYEPSIPAVWVWEPLQTGIIEITYSELKSLRDNSQLVSGQQYRITDYVTTTAQSGTTSAGHQFDIIVTADDVNKLNENARAINHPDSFVAFIDNRNQLIYVRYPDGDNTNEDEGYENYQICWNAITESQGESFDDITDWTDLSGYLAYTETTNIGIGTYVYDFENGEDDEVVEFTNISSDYFASSKLESWELKYCLDNDTDRFGWAQVGQEGFAAIQVKDEYDDSTTLWKRYPQADVPGGDLFADYDYAWVQVNNSVNKDFDDASIDWNDTYTEYPYWTASATPEIGEDYLENQGGTMYLVEGYNSNAGEVPSGKGVIYYMKDEWNNQVYFDFKNIMIYTEDYADYVYLYGDNEMDNTLVGTSNSNIIKGEISWDENTYVMCMKLDTSYYSDSDTVGYQNIVKLEPTIEGSADITFDSAGTPTGITNVSFVGYNDEQLFDVTQAKVKMTFNYTQNGMNVTDVCYGNLQKENMIVTFMQVEQINPNIILTFNRLNIANPGHICTWCMLRSRTSVSISPWGIEQR